MTNILRTIYLAQITDTELILDYDGVVEVIPWLKANGYEIIGWEGLVKSSKNGIVQPKKHRMDIESEIGGHHAGGDKKISSYDAAIKTIREAFNDWRSDPRQENEKISFCLILNRKLPVQEKKLRPLVRGFAGFLGLSGLFMIVGFFVAFFSGNISNYDSLWALLLSGLFISPIMFYAAITGNGRLRPFDDPMWFAKILLRNRVRLENGTKRWKVFQ